MPMVVVNFRSGSHITLCDAFLELFAPLPGQRPVDYLWYTGSHRRQFRKKPRLQSGILWETEHNKVLGCCPMQSVTNSC